MGRAIDQDNRLDSHDSKFNDFDRRLKLVEDALEEMVQTRVHHVDLHDGEEFTPPAGKRKKTTKIEKSIKETEKSSAEA